MSDMKSISYDIFKTREFNEKISCNEKHFTNRKRIMKFETKPILKANFRPQTSNTARKFKQTILFLGDKLDSKKSDTYEAPLYDPNSISYVYISRIHSEYY